MLSLQHHTLLHYAFVYESAEKPRVESNGANDLVTISTKPEQQNTVLPKTTNQPASDQQKAPKLEVQEEKVSFDRQEYENVGYTSWGTTSHHTGTRWSVETCL